MHCKLQHITCRGSSPNLWPPDNLLRQILWHGKWLITWEIWVSKFHSAYVGEQDRLYGGAILVTTCMHESWSTYSKRPEILCELPESSKVTEPRNSSRVTTTSAVQHPDPHPISSEQATVSGHWRLIFYHTYLQNLEKSLHSNLKSAFCTLINVKHVFWSVHPLFWAVHTTLQFKELFILMITVIFTICNHDQTSGRSA